MNIIEYAEYGMIDCIVDKIRNKSFLPKPIKSILVDTIINLGKQIDKEKENTEFYKENAEFYKEMYDKSKSRMQEIEIENKRLQDDNFKLQIRIPDKFPVERIMGTCSNAAWYGTGKHIREFVSDDDCYTVQFFGHTYEPSYECFSAACDVYLISNGERKILYSVDDINVEAYRNKTIETGSIEDIKNCITKIGKGFSEITKQRV